jgi:hypothetical protein
MELNFTSVNKLILVVALCLGYQGGVVTTAYGQISYTTAADLKAETKKNKKEAASFEADHKESHLNVADFTYKKGKPGRKVLAVDEEPTDYDYDKDINALYYSPKELKKKKLLKKQKQKRE